MFHLRGKLERLERVGKDREKAMGGYLNREISARILCGSKNWRDNEETSVSGILNVNESVKGRGREKEKEREKRWIVHRLLDFVLNGLKLLPQFLLTTITIIFATATSNRRTKTQTLRRRPQINRLSTIFSRLLLVLLFLPSSP